MENTKKYNVGDKFYSLCGTNFNEAEIISEYEARYYDRDIRYYVLQKQHGTITYTEDDFSRTYGKDHYSRTKDEAIKEAKDNINAEIRGFKCRIKEKEAELSVIESIVL